MKKKYSTGGQVLGSLTSLIPGYGQILGPLIMTADSLVDPNEKAPTIPKKPTLNPLGFAFGGQLQQTTNRGKNKVDFKNILPIAVGAMGLGVAGLYASKQKQKTGLTQPTLPTDNFRLQVDNLLSKPIQTPDYSEAFKQTKTPEFKNLSALGGPLFPQESTAIKPVVIRQPQQKTGYNAGLNLPYTQAQATQMGLAPDFMRLLNFTKNEESTKKAPSFRFREKALGGLIQDGFKQYQTGSHKSGNDLTVNQFGKPDANGQSAVQNKENIHDGYVMSDVLKNPETGNTFNIDAGMVNKKYKNTRFNPDERNAFRFELNRLKKANDLVRTVTQPGKFWTGGPLQVGASEPYKTLPDNLPFNVPTMLQENLPTIMTDPSIGTDTTSFGQEVTLGNNLSERFVNVPTTANNSGFKPTTSQIANGIGLGLKAAALVKSASDAVQNPVKEELIRPNYSLSDKYMREANIDYSQARQNALGVSNVLGNVNRSATRNFNQFAGRESARVGQLLDQFGQIDMQQANANSQLNLSKVQYESAKAGDIANRRYQNQQNNLANQAAKRDFSRDFFSNLSQIGTEFNRYGESQKAIQNRKELSTFNNNQVLAYLNAKYPNLQVRSDVIENFKTGKLSVDDFLSFVPTQTAKDIRQNVNYGN